MNLHNLQRIRGRISRSIDTLWARYHRPHIGHLGIVSYTVQRRLFAFWRWEVYDRRGRMLQGGWCWTREAAIQEAEHWGSCTVFHARRGAR